MKTKPHIPAFTASKGTWKLVGTKSTGKYTCTDTYRLQPNGEFQDIDRDRLHSLVKQGKVTLI